MNARDVENWWQRAEHARVLSALDVELGRFVLERDGGQPLAALATALASQAVEQGHACLPLTAVDAILAASGADIAHLPALPPADSWRTALAASRCCTLSDVASGVRTPLWLDADDRLYLTRYARHEARAARNIRRLLAAADDAPVADVDWMRKHIARSPESDESAIDWQDVAVLTGLVSRLTVITGGPGTGKTSTVARLLQVLIADARDHARALPSIALAAPTGKAAARLGETLRAWMADADPGEAERIAMPTVASTLHRLLGVRRGSPRFHHDHRRPLAADVVVVDEASMVDLPLMARLLDALKPDARLVLLGDRDQLASVQAGQVLAGICAAAGEAGVSAARGALIHRVLGVDVPATEAAPPLADAVVTLRHSYRFGSDSGLGAIAAAVRDGDAEAACAVLREARFADVRWVHGEVRRIVDQVLPACVAVLEARDAATALHRADHVRVLTAVRQGPFGCDAINAMIEESLRRRAGVGAQARWYPGRVLLITANDIDAGLFNGDVGVVREDENHRLSAWFPGADGPRPVPLSALPSHESGFAMTIHKSQGSEFDEVCVVLPPRARVLGRELLYTALTRARHRVHVLADETTLRATMERRARRFGGLADRLGR